MLSWGANVVAVKAFLAAVFLGEAIVGGQLIGGAVIVVGILVSRLGPPAGHRA